VGLDLDVALQSPYAGDATDDDVVIWRSGIASWDSTGVDVSDYLQGGTGTLLDGGHA